MPRGYLSQLKRFYRAKFCHKVVGFSQELRFGIIEKKHEMITSPFICESDIINWKIDKQLSSFLGRGRSIMPKIFEILDIAWYPAWCSALDRLGIHARIMDWGSGVSVCGISQLYRGGQFWYLKSENRNIGKTHHFSWSKLNFFPKYHPSELYSNLGRGDTVIRKHEI